MPTRPEIPRELADIISIHRGLFGGFRMMADDGGGDGGGGGGQQQQAKTFTQEELNSILAEDRRKNEAKYADYAELQKKAKQFDDVEAANKSEMQKALDRAAAAEKRAADFEAADKARQEKEAHAEQVKTWVAAAAKKHGVPENAIKGDTEAEIKAHAETLASLLPRKGHVPSEGDRPNGDGNSELRDVTRQLFHPNE